MADPWERQGDRPPLFLDHTEARRTEKNFLETGPPPFSKGLDDCSPPPTASPPHFPPPAPHLTVWIPALHCAFKMEGKCLFSFHFHPSVPCDHMRAPEYYTASVQGSCSWTAYPCVNYATFEQRKCQVCDGACPSMGFDADRTKKEGTFFLKTNSKAPFCGKSVFPK